MCGRDLLCDLDRVATGPGGRCAGRRAVRRRLRLRRLPTAPSAACAPYLITIKISISALNSEFHDLAPAGRQGLAEERLQPLVRKPKV